MAIGDTYILDLSIEKPLPADGTCDCTSTLSKFCSSLIPQPWMQHKSHCPAVECLCGKRYYSYAKKAVFNSKPVPATAARPNKSTKRNQSHAR